MRATVKTTEAVTVAVLALGAMLPLAQATAAQDAGFPGVELDLTYETGRRPVIAVQPIGAPPNKLEAARTIRQILANDLRNSDHFTVLGELPGVGTGIEVDYSFWDQVNTDWLLVARLEPGAGNNLYIELHDVVYRRVHHGAVYPLPDMSSGSFRMAVHVAHDDIYQMITGQPGMAASRIAFSIQEDDGRQEIWIIDSDGENLTQLTDGASTVAPGEPAPIAMSPNWSPDGSKIAYSTTRTPSGTWGIRERVLATAEERVIDFGREGQFYSPAYVADGRMVMSGYTGTQSGLFLYDVERDCCLQALSTGSAEVSPAPSPDGRRMAFATGRLGPPQIYTGSLTGDFRPRGLSPYRFGAERRYYAPDWSPDGKKVAFHGELDRGVYQIVVADMEREGDRFQQLTDGNGRNESNEEASWAPDSRHLVFVGTRSSGHGLYVLDTVTRSIRPLLRGRHVKVPEWGPPIRPGGER